MLEPEVVRLLFVSVVCTCQEQGTDVAAKSNPTQKGGTNQNSNPDTTSEPNTSPDTQNTVADTQIQVHAPKYKSRHPNASPDVPNTNPDT